ISSKISNISDIPNSSKISESEEMRKISNIFEVPSIINYKTSTLKKKYQTVSEQTSNTIFTHEYILKLIQDDNFIIKLLQSEKKWLLYKRQQYNKTIQLS